MKQYFLIVATVFLFFGCKHTGGSEKIVLQTGDIIFQNLDCGPLCEAINAVTEGYEGLDFNHLGMVVIENDSVFIIEAAGEAVRKVSLEGFLSSSSDPHYVGRLKEEYRKLIPEATAFLKTQIGTPYDEAYLYDNGKYYCSELMYDAFLYANGSPFFVLEPMTFKKPGTDEFFQAWKEYYDELGISIPEGEPGCNPAGLSRSERIYILGIL